MKKLNRILGLGVLSVSLSACGGNTAETKNPDQAAASASAAAAKKKVSAEARKEFDKAAEKYTAAMEDGSLSPGECTSVAGAFQRVYDTYGDEMLIAGFNAGAIWDECGDTAKASQIYSALGKKNFHLALNNLGVIEWNKGNQAKALEYFQKSLDADRARAFAARNNLAASHRDRYTEKPNDKDFEVAQSMLQNVLAVDSSNRMAYENLARLYYDRGRLKDPSYLVLCKLVIGQATQLLAENNEESAELANISGLLFMEQDNQVDALRKFKEAVRIAPNHTDANLNIAFISIRFRDFETAEKSLAIAMKDPAQKRNVEAYLAMGVATRGLRKFKEAEKFFDEAAKLAGSDPRPHFNLGILYQDHLVGEDGVDIKKMEELFNVAKGHYNKAVSDAGGNAKWNDVKEAAKLRIYTIDEAIESFRVAEKLAKEAAQMEAEAKKAAEEERKRLLELEEKARAAEEAGGAAGGDS